MGLSLVQVMRWPEMRMNKITSQIWDMNDMEYEISAQRTAVGLAIFLTPLLFRCYLPPDPLVPMGKPCMR